jgi:putative Holliday junction resolvase
LKVDLMDERLTSAAAERTLLEAGMRRERRKRMAHRVSAALILQSYLDKTRSGRRA